MVNKDIYIYIPQQPCDNSIVFAGIYCRRVDRSSLKPLICRAISRGLFSSSVPTKSTARGECNTWGSCIYSPKPSILLTLMALVSAGFRHVTQATLYNIIILLSYRFPVPVLLKSLKIIYRFTVCTLCLLCLSQEQTAILYTS